MRPSPSPFAGPMPVLTTDQLLLRAFVSSDAVAVEAAVSDVAVAEQTLSIPHPYPPGAAVDFIAATQREWSAGTVATWAVVQRDVGAVVGAVMLRFAWPHRRAEIGYWIARAAWGRGIATEAVRVVLEYGFDRRGLHRVEARRWVGNEASGRVLAKAWFRDEGVLRGALVRDGIARDVIISGRLRDDP
ncbi:MAG: GNAT family N-acetyltransferase, partial [Gemmatimonadota bacterium]